MSPVAQFRLIISFIRNLSLKLIIANYLDNFNQLYHVVETNNNNLSAGLIKIDT